MTHATARAIRIAREERTPQDDARSVAACIRKRLIDAGQRFNANDNIAAFIHPGELDALRDEVEERMQDVLDTLVIDTANDHNTVDTAHRVARMFVDEVFRGRYEHAPRVTSFPNVAGIDELIIVGPITVRSACSHHLCPIMGRIWLGVVPDADSDLIGLSKYARLCDWVMSRPQIQEEAVAMIADEFERRIRPVGLAILMEATHFCIHWRGVRDGEASMTSSAMRGTFRHDAGLRREFLHLAKGAAGRQVHAVGQES